MKFAQFCAAADMSSAEDLQDIIKCKRSVLTAMSEDWNFEHCLLSLLCGSTADERCAHSIMAVLPTAARAADIKECIAKLDQMQGSELLKMSPVAVQAACFYFLDL